MTTWFGIGLLGLFLLAADDAVFGDGFFSRHPLDKTTAGLWLLIVLLGPIGFLFACYRVWLLRWV